MAFMVFTLCEGSYAQTTATFETKFWLVGKVGNSHRFDFRSIDRYARLEEKSALAGIAPLLCSSHI